VLGYNVAEVQSEFYYCCTKNSLIGLENKVYVKPNIGLLVHYQSHVDNRYKRSLLTTMLWPYFSEECERSKSLFSRLDYPHHLINSTINTFEIITSIIYQYRFKVEVLCMMEFLCLLHNHIITNLLMTSHHLY